jgi:signal transduction histidine kinase
MILLASIFAAVFLKQKNKLDKLNSLKDNFFSVVAHDLRNPVNSIQNIAGVLSSDYDEINEKDKAELTSILQKSANMLTSLISNLFTWSTFQQGINNYNPEKFNISLSLKDTTDVLKHNASDKDIKLEYTAASDLYITADKKMIDSVVLNLITNAIKFSPSNSVIKISVYKEGSFAEILVADNGVGISEETQKLLFKFDKKIISRGTGGEKGSGLGLLICKEFVEKNKGTIRFESEVGKGSKFFVRLPLA